MAFMTNRSCHDNIIQRNGTKETKFPSKSYFIMNKKIKYNLVLCREMYVDRQKTGLIKVEQ